MLRHLCLETWNKIWFQRPSNSPNHMLAMQSANHLNFMLYIACMHACWPALHPPAFELNFVYCVYECWPAHYCGQNRASSRPYMECVRNMLSRTPMRIWYSLIQAIIVYLLSVLKLNNKQPDSIQVLLEMNCTQAAWPVYVVYIMLISVTHM